jgi:hypothetical protein
VNIQKITIPAFCGTSAMTTYSYLLSGIQGSNFKEPVLLAKLISRLTPGMGQKRAEISGWVLHYMVGVLFTVIYRSIFKKRLVSPNARSAAFIGGVSGIFAVGVWKIVLDIHPIPPTTKRRNFFGQLVVAHVIFGVVTILLLKRFMRARSHSQTKFVQSQPVRAGSPPLKLPL